MNRLMTAFQAKHENESSCFHEYFQFLKGVLSEPQLSFQDGLFSLVEYYT